MQAEGRAARARAWARAPHTTKRACRAHAMRRRRLSSLSPARAPCPRPAARVRRLASGFSYSDVQQEPPALGMPLALAAADVDGDVPPDGATTPVSGRAASPTLPPMPPPAEVTVPPPPVAPVAIAPTAVDDGPTSGGA